MLSTLRVGGMTACASQGTRHALLRPAGGLLPSAFGSGRCGLGPALRLGLPQQLGQDVRRFCEGKKPPQGFENFYKRNKAKAEKAESKAEGEQPKAEGSKEAEGSQTAEGAKKGPKETPGKASEGKSEEASGTGSSSSSSSGSKKTGRKEDDGSTIKLPNGTEVSRQTLSMAAGIVAFLAYSYFQNDDTVKEITIQELMREHLQKGHVERIQVINKAIGRVHLRADAPVHDGHVLRIQLGSPESFEQKLEQLQLELGISALDFVPVQYVNETSLMAELMPILPSLLFLIPLVLFARSMSGGMGGMGGGGGGAGGGARNMFNIGKAFPSGQKDLKSKVTFKDVAGMGQAKREVVEFVDFLKSPDKYTKLGARIPKGGLLVGPPGTGKTLLAKAVAGEADCPFFSMCGSDFIEMFVGVGPSRVRDLFKQAREKAPSIIFIDEIDAIGRSRGKGGQGGANDERENTLNQMLVEMDGFSSTAGIVVLAGTNRADVLDSALTRPGRFDRQIAVDKPDITERAAIFEVHLKPIMTAEGLDKESVAQRMSALTPGFAGADIANICNESAIFAARRNAKGVEMVDFERATERIMGGLPKENGMMSQTERRTVALHESGHALAGWFLKHADPLLKVSIQPRSNGALGFAQYLPEEMSLHSQEAILDKIAVSLGGRAAEELFVGRISTGASDDLDKVTKMAYAMVQVYGMNPKIGLISFSQNDSSQQFYKPYSDELGQLIDNEARIIIDAEYERVKDLLNEKKDLVHAMADALLKEDTLVYNQLVGLLGERPFGIKDSYKQFVTASGSSPFTAGFDDAKAADAEGASSPVAENAAEPKAPVAENTA